MSPTQPTPPSLPPLHDHGPRIHPHPFDRQSLPSFYPPSRLEGILPAPESAHAVAHACKLAAEKTRESILVNLSGRGDKDIDFVVENYGLPDEG